jgi:hypothetical protein
MRFVRLVIATLLLAATATAQVEQRTFQIPPGSPAVLDAAHSTLLGLTGMEQTAWDIATGSLTLSGTSDAMRLAEWYLAERAKPIPYMVSLSSVFRFRQGNRDQVARIFYLDNYATPQEMNEMLTAFRTITDVQQFGVEPARSQVTLAGSQEQLDAAAWMFTEFNRSNSAGDYVQPGFTEDNVLRVFRLPYGTQAAFNEMQTLLRTITDARRVYPMVSRRVVFVRANAEITAHCEWLVREFDRTLADHIAGVAPVASPEAFHARDRRGATLTRVFYLKAGSAQEFNEVQTMIRTIADIRQLYPYYGREAIAIRGTEDQIATAEWLLEQAQRTTTSTPYLFSRLPPAREDDRHIRVYAVPATDAKQFDEVQTMLRTITLVRRSYAYHGHKLLAIRGTADDLAAVEWLLAERNKAEASASYLYSRPIPSRPQYDERHVRVFRFEQGGERGAAEVVQLLRGVVEPRYVFATGGKIYLRGTEEQMSAAEWIVTQLTPELPRKEYGSSTTISIGAELAQLFFLPSAASPDDMSKKGQAVRTVLESPAYIGNIPRVIAVRGTPENVARAAALAAQ